MREETTMKLDDASACLGRIDNMSGQVCQLDANGKPVLILFDIGCPNCSEVASKNADELADALVTLANAAPALLSERNRLRMALSGLVGAGDANELRAMEAVMRVLPAPDNDKTSMLNAIRALLDVQ